MKTAAEISSLLSKLDGLPADALESEELEFKPWIENPKELGRVLREYAVCFANANGGTLVLGVRERTRTRREALEGVGPYDPAGVRRSIYDGTDPHLLVEIEELKVPEGVLLLVNVPKGIPPHMTTDGLAKIRMGKECKPLTGQTLARMVGSGAMRDPSAEIVDQTTIADLSAEAMKSLRSTVGRESQAAQLARLGDEELLRALQLVTPDGGVTMAGLLLLGAPQVIARRLPQHEVTFARGETTGSYDQRRDLRQALLLVLEQLEQLISVHNRVRTVQEEGLGELEFPDVSWVVAREAVLNAVTHRDYFLRQSVHVTLYRDRLEVTSPGGFVGGITPENIIRHPPVHRNELLARTFQAVGLVNRLGLGVDRIFEELLRAGKDVPKYSGDESHVRLVVPLLTHPGFAGFVAREARSGVNLELDDLLILRALTKTSLLDRWSAARVLQLSEEEAAQRLARLREAGYLVVRGRGRGSAYTLPQVLAERFRGRDAVDAEADIDAEAVRLRTIQLLRDRGSLTNREIRRFSGFSRARVYRLLKELESEGVVELSGRGRGARVVPGERLEGA
jgi:ATP-dependent DNA helicase RecG